MGDLIYSFVLKHSTDIAVATETCLNNEIEYTFIKIREVRRDRPGRAGEGLAVCFRENIQTQYLQVYCKHLQR